MAIGADSLIDFFGTQDSLDGTSTSSVSNNAFSTINATTGMNSWTNDDDAPAAAFLLVCQFGTAPTDGSVINLYGRKLNVEGINDTPVPTAVNTDQYMGSFTVDGDLGTSTDMYLVTGWLTLPNHYSSQVYEFYFENQTGQTISAGWEFHVTPVTKGPHA